MQMEFDMRLNMLRDKENRLSEYNRMIDETEKTYIRVNRIFIEISNIDGRDLKSVGSVIG